MTAATDAKAVRVEWIGARRAEGWSMVRIAAALGVSANRVRQLILEERETQERTRRCARTSLEWRINALAQMMSGSPLREVKEQSLPLTISLHRLETHR